MDPQAPQQASHNELILSLQSVVAGLTMDKSAVILELNEVKTHLQLLNSRVSPWLRSCRSSISKMRRSKR
eukprot:11485395-Karenia_brevis.AAC.1